MFYCLNGRLPTATGHLLLHDDKKPEEVKDETLNLKQFHAKFQGTRSNSLVSTLFICALALFLGAKDQVA